MSFGRELDSKQEKPKQNSKKHWESKDKSLKHQKRPKTANFAKNRKKPRKKVSFGRESDSIQEKPKQNSKKYWESKDKKAYNTKNALKTPKKRPTTANFG